MNTLELDLLQLLSGIDEKYICEAQEDCHHRKTRLRKFPLAVAAAILLSALLAVGASAAVRYYISHRENALHEYGNNAALISEIEKRAGEQIVCENAHLRMTVDTVISDEIYIRCTATLEGLDNEGRQFISSKLILPEEVAKMTDSEIADYFENFNRNDSDYDQFIPYMLAFSQSGEMLTGFNSFADKMFGKKGDEAEATFTFGKNKSNFGNNDKVKIECNQLKTYFSEQQSAGIFEGMSFELPLASNFDTLILESESGSKVIYLSEVCLYENREATEHEDFLFSVYYKDGTARENLKEAFTDCELYILEDIDHIDFNGVLYYPSELLKARLNAE